MTADLRATLAAADPVRHDSYDDAELVRKARAILGAADETLATVDDTLIVRPVAPASPRSRRGRTAAVLAVAAVLAGGIAVVPALVGRTTHDHQRASALLDAAADAITASDPPARGDQYWRITSDGFSLAELGGDPVTAVALLTQPTTSYVAVDGSRPTINVSAPATVLRRLVGTSADAAALLAGAQPMGVSAIDPAAQGRFPASWQSPTPAFLAVLPRDPVALAERIRADTEGQGSSADGEVVVTVEDVLDTGLVPADLRAALYRVLAAVPGIEVTTEDVTVGGRTGVAFSYREAANGIRKELVVDPSTGVLVAEREVATTTLDGVPAGTVISQRTTTRQLVDGVPSEVVAGTRVFHCVTASDGNVTCTG